MVAYSLTHHIIIIFFLCRARSSISHTSSRLTVSRLKWQPVLTSTCSLFCSLRLPLHPVLAWPKLCRARIRSSWWALPSSAVPYRNAKTLEIPACVEVQVLKEISTLLLEEESYLWSFSDWVPDGLIRGENVSWIYLCEFDSLPIPSMFICYFSEKAACIIIIIYIHCSSRSRDLPVCMWFTVHVLDESTGRSTCTMW